MVKLGGATEDIIGALINVYSDNSLEKNYQFTNGYFVSKKGRDKFDERIGRPWTSICKKKIDVV